MRTGVPAHTETDWPGRPACDSVKGGGSGAQSTNTGGKHLEGAPAAVRRHRNTGMMCNNRGDEHEAAR